MRLLNTKTLTVEEFYTDIPPYAILSHTWGKEEVTFQDIQNLEAAKHKAGWAKVESACNRARRYEFAWIWIDSCCINKESSAELSEAINSMHQYYEDAVVCYVYLHDVSAEHHPLNPKSNFCKARWFTRGWTLQELLAPKQVIFLDTDWGRIGTRWSLRHVVSAVTSIPVEVFMGRSIDNYSVAQKMSWAALRVTTRPEDQAYCLLGIFSVSMPPIYGEGGVKAFMRLQQEIIKISDDRSIFAWVGTLDPQSKRGLLARCPYEFRMSSEVMASKSDEIGLESSFSFGNNGLRIHLSLQPVESSPSVFLASLYCQSGRDGSYLAVYLKKEGQRYYRIRAHDVALSHSPLDTGNMQEVIVTEALLRRSSSLWRTGGYDVKLLPSAAENFACDHESVEEFKLVRVPDEPSPRVFVSTMNSNDTLVYTPLNDTGSPFSIAFPYVSTHTFPDLDWVFDPDNVGLPCSEEDVVLGQSDSYYMSITCEGTGDNSGPSPDSLKKVLEIDYVLKTQPESIFLGYEHQEISNDLGVMVPNMLSYRDFELAEIFPPDCSPSFGRTFDKETYITFSDSGNDHAPSSNIGAFSSNTFRVVSYSFYTDTVYIAFGFHLSEPWMDVVHEQSGSQGESSETILDIWNSYSDIGSRAQKRINHQTSAMVYFQYRSCNLIVSIEKRCNLQLGTHFIRIEERFKRYNQGQMERNIVYIRK